MPTETLEDTEGILSLIEKYDSLISNIESPISLEEAKVIIFSLKVFSMTYIGT